ncbi:OsmC family protein [Sinomicrobium soli]|uniref:OsmC family protein n=1 Tax=Sinomicrobium sp. N-1-3-6 TaxID=2219864 RepID=UPI000DCC1EF9|nr:OsmC family protein [Sinomicrobium sp. N-1-3-6]RAV30587.1 OsmC family peroxiredoxin [Sinomicrobium sp. N-1-3-6]
MAKNKGVTACNGLDDYMTRVTDGKHVFFVDEPESLGGGDKKASPTDYLLGALASCTAITMRMYAQRKEWKPGTIKVHASFAPVMTPEGVQQRIRKEVSFEKELSGEQVKRLLEIGERCPVSKMLNAEVPMEMERVAWTTESK